MNEIIKKIISEAVSEIYIPKESDNFVDKNGKRIVTGRMVKLGEKRGYIRGVTADLKVTVEWILPVEIRDTKTAVDPKQLEIY